MVALSAIFGNKKLFIQALNFSLDALDRGLIGGDGTALTQLFILRLSERYLGLTTRNWLSDPYPWAVDPCEVEPLFADIFLHWDDADTSILEQLLIQLLNRHTFQASRNNKDGSRDFEGGTEQFPLEILFIFRLREWLGLNNPVLSHPIMLPPFDRLTDPMAQIEYDDQSIKLMSKIREVFPEFDHVVSGARIRDWQMLL